MDSETVKPRRRTTRAVLLDPAGRVLLVRFNLPGRHGARETFDFWATVGGAIEPGESLRAALAREILEETGLGEEDLEICGPVWHGEYDIYFEGANRRFEEHFYLVRTRQTKVSRAHLPYKERSIIKEHRWWSVDQIRASKERIYPPGLADLLMPLTAGKIPGRIVEIRREQQTC